MAKATIDDAVAPTLDSQRELTTRLQGQMGGPRALGRWTRFTISDCKIVAHNAAAGGVITASGDGGGIAFVNLGETTLLEFDTDFLTTAGAVTRVILTMPEGYSYYPRALQRNSTQTQRCVGIVTVNSNGAVSVGLVIIGSPKANQITIFRDALATVYANGTLAIYGQVAFENMYQMEHQ